MIKANAAGAELLLRVLDGEGADVDTHGAKREGGREETGRKKKEKKEVWMSPICGGNRS